MSKTLSWNFESCNNNKRDVEMQQENSTIDYCCGNTGCGLFKWGIQNLKSFKLINILKGNYWFLRIGLVGRCQKLDIILVSKVIWKMMLSKNFNNKRCAPKLIFFNEKKFEKDSNNFWHRKLTLKVKFWHLLTKPQSYIKHWRMSLIEEYG